MSRSDRVMLWSPSDHAVERAQIARFAGWVQQTRDVAVVGDYGRL